MSYIDWLVCIIPIAMVLGFSVYAQRYFKTTADFLVASRTGGRYLLTATNGIAGIGVITFVAGLESFNRAGWTMGWWNNLAMPIMTLLAVTGFVFYRYRQTRVMTMAQFFEVRYSRKFRIWMGAICFISGVLNFGIFPAITTQFFMIFLNIPTEIMGLPTYPILMFILLGTAATITIAGGQIQNMVTDTIQALWGYVFCVVISISVVLIFTLSDFTEAMTTRTRGYSFVDPFDSAKVGDFNVFLVIIAILSMVYSTGAFQGSQGYAGAAINPHEGKMGGILNTWRQISIWIFTTLMALGALTYLYLHPELKVFDAFGNLSSAPRDSMIAALSQMFPVGIKGMFAALMFFFMLSTDTTYIHSWGVILVQDVILPLHGKKVSQKQHLLLLRIAIALVAICGYLFSLLYMQSEYILMFQMATGAFFSAAGGSAIIGGLYWKKGTTKGAWSALIVGVGISSISLVVMEQRGWQFVRNNLIRYFGENAFWMEAIERCPINGAWLGFFAIIAAIVAYVVVSLWTTKEPYNMDKLLHRGAYKIKTDEVEVFNVEEKISIWKRVFLGFDHEFSKNDKILAVLVFIWTMFWFLCFVVITLWNIWARVLPEGTIMPWTDQAWFDWTMFQIKVNLVLAPITAVWLSIGGIKDMIKMFEILKFNKHNTDDGFVKD